MISLNDLLPTTPAYATLRTWENPSVRRYLSQIQIWDENRYWPGLGFRYLEGLAIEIRFLIFDELRSTPTQVILTARVAGFDPVVSVFRFEGRRIASIADYPSMEAAQSAMAQG